MWSSRSRREEVFKVREEFRKWNIRAAFSSSGGRRAINVMHS
jgi:hypothetical protein